MTNCTAGPVPAEEATAMTEGQRQLRMKGTQKEIARRCGVTPPAVFKWMMGRSKPDYSSRLTLKRVYGIELDAWDREWSPPAPTRRTA